MTMNRRWCLDWQSMKLMCAITVIASLSETICICSYTAPNFMQDIIEAKDDLEEKPEVKSLWLCKLSWIQSWISIYWLLLNSIFILHSLLNSMLNLYLLATFKFYFHFAPTGIWLVSALGLVQCRIGESAP